MAKTLCDWSKKDIAKNLDFLSEIVMAPRFVCGKCARTASAKKYLCRPTSLRLPEPVVLQVTKRTSKDRPAA